LDKNRLWWAELKGATEILLRLLDEGPMYTSKLYKYDLHPSGVGSPSTVSKIIGILVKLGLIERNTEQMRPRVYLHLTGIGIDVAHHLKAIEDILKDQSSSNP